MKTILTGVILSVLAVTVLSAEPKKTVAVMLFKNDTGSASMQYLSGAFAESVSTVISQNRDITVAERAQLAGVLKQIELQQTGLFDDATAVKAGKLAKADVLIIGSYTGSADNLTVNIKAVDIATGRSVDGRMVQAPLSAIFDKTGQAALAMTGIIAGKNIGYVTVTTNPDNCEIWLDGVLVGRSPLIEYKVTEGKHTLMAISKGFAENEQTITVKSGQKSTYAVSLIEKAKGNRMAVGFGIGGYIPREELLYPGAIGTLFLSNIMGNITLTVEGSFVYGIKDESIDLGFKTVEHTRSVSQYSINGIFKYTPYDSFTTLLPYAGILVGAGKFKESYEKNGTYETTTSAGVAYLSPIAGVLLYPHGSFSFYLETRYYIYFSGKEPINEYSSAGIFGVQSTPKNVSLNAAAISLGVVYNFK